MFARSLAKTMTWRVTASLVTATAAWLVVGDLSLAILIGGWDAAVKTVLYFLHELIWERET